MKKSHLLAFFIFLLFAGNLSSTSAASNLAEKLSGYILLQVESLGEAWYVNPVDKKRHSLGKPKKAFQVIRQLGIGISNSDLKKIPIGLANYEGEDADNDGLIDNLEIAIGTGKNEQDTDHDGYEDKKEIINGYNPLGDGKQTLDQTFFNAHSGEIFLQTEKNGEAWYLDPQTKKRYFLGRPLDAFNIMKKLGLGISNNNLKTILISSSEDSEPASSTPTNPKYNYSNILDLAADAIRGGRSEDINKFFVPNMNKSLDYTFDFLNRENKFVFANILSSAKLSSQTNTKKIYIAEVYFNGAKQEIKINVEKQNDGSWLITNL